MLQAGPDLQARQQVEPVPELGGSVIVRGLMASEVFAIEAVRAQSVARVRQAAADHRTLVRELRARFDERVAGLPTGVAPPEFTAPEFVAPALTLDELQQYGRFASELLARAVVVPSGLPLYTADQWELMQQHPGKAAARARLLQVAEALSGINAEDVEKN